MDRVYKIAQTGQTAEPSAVDNIMAQYQPKQEQGGFWNGLKDFAGSNTGRMVIGGLLGTAAGAIAGRSGKEALLGGLAGITGAANGITSRNQYLNNIAEKRQERADRMAEAEKLRQHQLTMQANNIQANKDAADLAFERKMDAIREGRDYAEQQKGKDKQIKIDAINSNPYLSDEQKAWQISQLDIPEFNNDAYYGSMLVRDPNNQDALNYFTNKAKLNNIMNPKDYGKGDLGLVQWVTEKNGGDWKSALEMVGKMSIDDKIRLEGGIAEAKAPHTMAIDNNKSQNALSNDITMAGINHKNNVAMEGLKHNYNVAMEDQRHNNAIAVADNKLENDMSFETYKRNLPPEKIIEAEYTAQSLQKAGYDVTAGDILNVAYQKDVLGNANTVASTNQTIANTDKTRAEIPFVGMTPQMQNYGFIQQHPDAANSPVFKGSTTNINIGESKEMQKQYVKDVDEYKNMVSKLPQLNETVAKLKELAPKATYTYIGQGVDFLGKQLVGKTTEGAEARAEYSAIVNNQILPLLRDTFGAQFTEREGAELRKTLGDLNASPDEKIAILEAFIAQKYADVESKRRKIEEYGYDTSNLPVVPQSVQSVGGFTIEREE